MGLVRHIVAFSKLPRRATELKHRTASFLSLFWKRRNCKMEKKELQDGKGKTERCNTKMLNKAECPMLKLIICKMYDFLPCCLFLLRNVGFRHPGCVEAAGVEGGRGTRAIPGIPTASHDRL